MKTKTWSTLLLAAVIPAGLLASSDLDRKIEQAAKASYNYRTVLEDKVAVASDNGAVTLTGKVQDRDQKDLAEDTVAALPGVVSVTNRIEVVPPAPEHSDAWITFQIRSLLLMKAHVSAASTSVKVADGAVTLSGTADSAAQKELTEVYAKEVDGVKSVRNEITVTENPPRAESVSADIDDLSITGQMKYALLSHNATSALKTKVATENGVVTISGEAASETERALVTELAQSIRGVKSVENKMTVKQ
jgi:hyperosmotically inducible periplasmic protein